MQLTIAPVYVLFLFKEMNRLHSVRKATLNHNANRDAGRGNADLIFVGGCGAAHEKVRSLELHSQRKSAHTNGVGRLIRLEVARLPHHDHSVLHQTARLLGHR